MLVECPSCKCRFTVKSGRLKNKIRVQNVLDTLRESSSIKEATIKLNCSRSTLKRRINIPKADLIAAKDAQIKKLSDKLSKKTSLDIQAEQTLLSRDAKD